MDFSLGTQERVQNSLGKRAIGVRAIEVLLSVNPSVIVKVFGGISFLLMAENSQHLKDTLAFSSFLVC